MDFFQTFIEQTAASFETARGAVGQIIGFIPMLLSFCTYSFRSREKILASKLISDIFGVCHLLLIGGYSGAAINVVNVGRDCVFYNKQKRWASHLFWPILFILLLIASSVLTWQGYVSILPTVGSCLALIGMWSNKPVIIRSFTLPGILLWLIYSILIASVSGVLQNTITVFSILIGFVRDLNAKATKTKSSE